MHRFLSILLLLPLLLSVSCQTYDPQEKIDRDARIRAEPRGDWYVGRRYHTYGTRFWGYLRRPGELWEDGSKLTIMKERATTQPDRLPEAPMSGPAFGYDHNYEYRVWGGYTGRKVYDPNADMELPEFAPTRFQLANERPGFLFDPRDKYDPRYLPSRAVKQRGY